MILSFFGYKCIYINQKKQKIHRYQINGFYQEVIPFYHGKAVVLLEDASAREKFGRWCPSVHDKDELGQLQRGSEDQS
jgi:hypothetical protein